MNELSVIKEGAIALPETVADLALYIKKATSMVKLMKSAKQYTPEDAREVGQNRCRAIVKAGRMLEAIAPENHGNSTSAPARQGYDNVLLEADIKERTARLWRGTARMTDDEVEEFLMNTGVPKIKEFYAAAVPALDPFYGVNPPRTRVPTPEGMTLEEYGRSEVTKDEPDRKIKDETFRRLRKILSTLDHEMSESDKDLTIRAVQVMNETGSFVHCEKIIQHIMDRIYGTTTNPLGMEASDERRVSKFEKGFFVLIDACKNTHHIEVPQISQDRLVETLAELEKAKKGLNDLARRLKELQ